MGLGPRGAAAARGGTSRRGARPARWQLRWRTPTAVSVDDMVNHALAALPAAGGPWIVVGHSGGGIVATMVAEAMATQRPGSIAGLVYLAGMMLPSGMGFPEACRIAGSTPPQGIEPFLQPTPDGRATWVPPEAAEEIFFQCADEGRRPSGRRPALPATRYELDDRAAMDGGRRRDGSSPLHRSPAGPFRADFGSAHHATPRAGSTDRQP